MIDFEGIKVDEYVVLEKFEGEPIPENLIERVHIRNGKIVLVEKVGEVN